MIAREYANALYDFSITNPTIEEEYKVLIDILKQDNSLIKLLSFPTISKNEKKEIIKKIAINFNIKFFNFLNVLIDNNRFENIIEIYDEFILLCNEKKNVMEVIASSAVLLSDVQLSRLISRLESKYKGKKIKIKNIIDPELIGGIKVIYDGQVIDLSVINKLDQLKSFVL